jgi:homocysteine S-methyltransferase
MKPFLEAIDERVLVSDGAMGTMLYAKGSFINRCFDALNLMDADACAPSTTSTCAPARIVIETNTFGANRIKLGASGWREARRHQRRGRAHREERRRGHALRGGRDRPARHPIEPWGRPASTKPSRTSASRPGAARGGVDLFILETFRDLQRARRRDCGGALALRLPIVAQMTIEEDGNSLDGTPPEQFAPALEQRRTSSASTAASARADARDDRAGCPRSSTALALGTAERGLAATTSKRRKHLPLRLPNTSPSTRGGSSSTACASLGWLLWHDA